MRIGIDVRALCWERSGFTRYIRNLLGNLAALDEENEYVLYMNSARKLEEVRGKSNFSVRVIRAPMPAYKYLSVPVCLARDRIDLFHSMTQELPFLSPCRMVTTCYDLNVEFFPGLYRWRVRMLSALRLARASARLSTSAPMASRWAPPSSPPPSVPSILPGERDCSIWTLTTPPSPVPSPAVPRA